MRYAVVIAVTVYIPNLFIKSYKISPPKELIQDWSIGGNSKLPSSFIALKLNIFLLKRNRSHLYFLVPYIIINIVITICDSMVVMAAPCTPVCKYATKKYLKEHLPWMKAVWKKQNTAVADSSQYGSIYIITCQKGKSNKNNAKLKSCLDCQSVIESKMFFAHVILQSEDRADMIVNATSDVVFNFSINYSLFGIIYPVGNNL